MNTRYEFNMDVPPREAIRLLYVSKSRFGGDWNSVPHTHSCTEVFYCVDGRGQFNVEGKMLDVAPDDIWRRTFLVKTTFGAFNSITKFS